MNKGELALSFHQQGYNCCQAVVMAFAEDMGLTPGQAARLTMAMGGGVGQLREICGAVSGAALVLGMCRGMEQAPSPDEKRAFYQRMRSLGEAFESTHQSVQCMALLKVSTRDDPMPGPDLRPCNQLIYDAAMLLKDDLDADNPNP